MLIDFQDVKLVTLIVAAILPFVLGFLWYSKTVFGKIWQQETGLTDKQLKQSRGRLLNTFALVFFANVIIAFCLSGILQSIDSQHTVMQGAVFGAFVGAGITGMSLMTSYLFAQRSNKLFLIDAGYIVVNLALMGAVIGAIK